MTERSRSLDDATSRSDGPDRSDGVGRGGPLTGTGTLLRFMLRRDRIRLPAWVLGMTALLTYFSTALGTVLDQSALESFADLATNPIMALIGGPGYGFDDITVGRLLVGLYGAYLMIGAALMSILTISRHTRVEEQSGRAELVRAGVVGRHAQLSAALLLTAIMNLTMSLLMAAVFQGSPVEPGSLPSSLLFTFGIGAVGLVFAGVAAVTLQLSPYSRAGSGFAGAVLAVGFVIRGFGDLSRTQGGGLSWLSWLSPFGWSQQTAPLTLDRWWPLTIPLGMASLLVIVGFALQARRDLGAGILPDRLGSAAAPPWMRNPVALVVRLQRITWAWWMFAMLLAGLTFGAFVQPMARNADGMPEEILATFGGADGVIDGYLGFMGVYYAIMVSVFAILSTQTLRSEEQLGRTELVLATSTGRIRWLLAWAGTTAAASFCLLGIAALGSGIGAVLSTGDRSLLGPVMLGGLTQTPTVWVLSALAVALYGLAPRLTALSWIVFLQSALIGLFGDMLDLDGPILATSVFRHIGQHPAEAVSWTSVGVLVVIAAGLVMIGTILFRRRDLTTA